jgi:alkylhydroperoxidase family enzyme
LVAAIAEAIQVPTGEPMPGEPAPGVSGHYNSNLKHGFSSRRPRPDPEQIAKRVERAGFEEHESLLVALATHATIASPLTDPDVVWIASAAARVADADLLLETAGVAFAFNAINRIADARRVRLEYHFLRELKPIRGWVERRLASLTGLAYDLSYEHQARQSPAELLDRVGILFERLGAPATPEVFNWLSRSPVVLEGVVEMLEANITGAGVRHNLLKEAAAIAVASRAMPGSGLRRAADQWLSQESLLDLETLHSRAVAPDVAANSDLESACRRYARQVANAAYTVTDEQIGKLSAFGLSDAELLDLTLATALFSALAIIETISAAVAPGRARRAHQVASAPQAAEAIISSSESLTRPLTLRKSRCEPSRGSPGLGGQAGFLLS